MDLDAAFGRGSNAQLLRSVIGELEINVQLSGGIANAATAQEALATDCKRVNLSTAAVEDRELCARLAQTYGDRLAISLDVRIDTQRDGSVSYTLAGRGGSADSGDLWETLGWLDDLKCACYVVTDVRRDGMLSGPNLELYEAISEVSATPLVASGGISSTEDLAALARLAARGVPLTGAVVGKALYAGRFSLAEAREAVRQS